MKKGTTNKTIKLSDFLAKLDDALENALSDFVSTNSGTRIIASFDSISTGILSKGIKDQIENFNECHSKYLELFKGKKGSRKTVDELSLISLNENGLGWARDYLKEGYIGHYGISMPGVKSSKVIELYDFPSEHEELINLIVGLLGNFPKSPGQYFNEASGTLIFNESHMNEIRDRNTKYVSEEVLEKIIALSLMCSGLSNLKMVGYSLTELPEIDIRIMRALRIDPQGTSVDFDPTIAHEILAQRAGRGLLKVR